VLQVDLSFLLLASKTLEFLNPELRRLSLGDIASDIKTTMLDELDFTKVISMKYASACLPQA
jgi:aarF domain-containing kinase